MNSLNIGADRVHVEGERVLIHAAEPMDWPIREFCKVPIYFHGRKYYLRSKRTGQKPRSMVYELWPWPADLHDASPQTVLYDEAYVLERNKAAGKDRCHQWLYLGLLPAYPVLGLFWSGFKNRVLRPVGFEPGSITYASIVLTISLSVAEAIFTGWLKCGILSAFLERSALLAVDWALLFVLGADSVLRFGQTLKMDVQEHWGVLEWLWPGKRAGRITVNGCHRL